MIRNKKLEKGERNEKNIMGFRRWVGIAVSK